MMQQDQIMIALVNYISSQ